MIAIRDLEWAAGFLEGEGSFSGGRWIRIGAAQVQKWPLERLQRLFGGSIVPHHVKSTGKQQPCNQWRLTGHQAAAVMMTLFSLLSPRRKEQIVATLTQWKMQGIEHRLKTRCPKGHPLRRARHGGGNRYCPICKAESRTKCLAKTKQRTFYNEGQRSLF